MLYGTKSARTFKSILLSDNHESISLDKFFFVWQENVTYLRKDSITIYSLDLKKIKAIAIPENELKIERVLAIPSEI